MDIVCVVDGRSEDSVGTEDPTSSVDVGPVDTETDVHGPDALHVSHMDVEHAQRGDQPDATDMEVGGVRTPTSDNQLERKQMYKKGINANESRCHRETGINVIRKVKRNESLHKRRQPGGGGVSRVLIKDRSSETDMIVEPPRSGEYPEGTNSEWKLKGYGCR